MRGGNLRARRQDPLVRARSTGARPPYSPRDGPTRPELGVFPRRRSRGGTGGGAHTWKQPPPAVRRPASADRRSATGGAFRATFRLGGSGTAAGAPVRPVAPLPVVGRDRDGSRLGGARHRGSQVSLPRCGRTCRTGRQVRRCPGPTPPPRRTATRYRRALYDGLAPSTLIRIAPVPWPRGLPPAGKIRPPFRPRGSHSHSCIDAKRLP